MGPRGRAAAGARRGEGAADDAAEEQLAKAEFGLGWYFHRQGKTEVAARHFARAGELSPDDFTVRRAAMPIMGIDPMTSPEFLDLYTKWTERGRPAYRSRPSK